MKLKIVIAEELPPEAAFQLLDDVMHGTVVYNSGPGKPTIGLAPSQVADVLNEKDRRLETQDQQLQFQVKTLKEQEELIADMRQEIDRLKAPKTEPKKRPPLKVKSRRPIGMTTPSRNGTHPATN